MRRARAELEVLEIDTEQVALQGETPAFRNSRELVESSMQLQRACRYFRVVSATKPPYSYGRES